MIAIVVKDVWSEFKEQVRAQTDIVALIAETRNVIPKGGGREYVALCPFHDDHDPSMRINAERQSYRCFVCDEGGDCFSYLMKLEGLDFRQTLEQLALRAGLEMPQRTEKVVQRQPGMSRTTLLEVLDWAAQQFHSCLLNHPQAQVARDYLMDRGFCEEIWSDFLLGFHPGGWDWLIQQARSKYTVAQLEAVRLVVPNKQGTGHYDFFRNRVIFPIASERGQVIAFGGRALPGSDDEKFGKYQNSSESPLFHKSRQLYGIEHASQAMRDRKQVIVVEGYTDCIALHQVGIANVVATLGTALTSEHVSLIRRFCQNVTLVFDGDQAGQDAALKALPLILSHDIELKLLAIPEKMDPPEFLERYGLQQFQKLLQQAGDAWEFKLQALLQKWDRESVYGREQIIEGMLALLAVAPNMQGTSRENFLLNRLANRVGLRGHQEELLHKQLAKLRLNGLPIAPGSSGSQRDSETEKSSSVPSEKLVLNYRGEVKRLLQEHLDRTTSLERDLLEILWTMPDCLAWVIQQNGLEQIKNSLFSRLLTECESLRQRNEFTGADSLLATFEDPDWKALILGIQERAEQKKIAEKLQETKEIPNYGPCPIYLSHVIEQLRWGQKESQHRKLTQQMMAEPASSAEVNDRLRQLLQDAALFHQQRVTRKTAST